MNLLTVALLVLSAVLLKVLQGFLVPGRVDVLAPSSRFLSFDTHTQGHVAAICCAGYEGALLCL